MKIKYFDSDLQKWVITGASNASNIELSNPAFMDEDGETISTDQGFTKIHNKIQKVEDNLAWIYLNGAKGGTGGPGGPGQTEITIEVLGGNTIYTSTGSVSFNIRIKTGAVSRPFRITIKNYITGKILVPTFTKSSVVNIPIQISGLTEDTIIEINAIDLQDNQATPALVTIMQGALNIRLVGNIPTSIIEGTSTPVLANFSLENSIRGAVSTFEFSMNNVLIEKRENITNYPASISYDLRRIIFNPDLPVRPVPGQKFNFKATASTILEGKILDSNTILFSVMVTDALNLIIITENIGEDITNITDFSQGSQLSFNYRLSYAPSVHNTFNIDYDIFSVHDGVKTKLDITRTIPNVVKGISQVFYVNTTDFPITPIGDYIEVEMRSRAVDNADDPTAQYTKRVYARIIVATEIELKANNDKLSLLAYFSKVIGFPASNLDIWTYPLKPTGTFPFNKESFMGNPLDSERYWYKYYEGVDLKLYKTNGISTGFLITEGLKKIPGIVLNGESYATLESAKQLFPAIGIGEGIGLMNGAGFNISLTYKTEKVSDTSGVVMSIGKYSNDFIDQGIEILLDSVNVGIGNADKLSVKLPVGELLTIDIDVSRNITVGWYFKIYVNGVLSAVTKVGKDSDIKWDFDKDIYFGCRNNNGVLNRYSNVTIYDMKVYTTTLTELAIVQNYISATEQASLIEGKIDPSLDKELRAKNFFNSEGICLIWDYTTDKFLEGRILYDKLTTNIENGTPYPLVLIRETNPSFTQFKAFTTALFSAGDKDTVMGARFPCDIVFKNKYGEVTVTTPIGVDPGFGVRVGIQGTSSLSYNAKNIELYLGDMTPVEGRPARPQLLKVDKNWLPENQFTLKADVMDSAHVNNVVIGKIINGEVKNASNKSVKPLSLTPPMLLSDNIFGGDNTKATKIRSKIKQTSDGFPCLVFVQFAPEITDEGPFIETRFMGIYNFNLGRHAYFNLGLKIITDYTLVNEIEEAPSLVTDYTEIVDHWNKGSAEKGVYSMEVNQNSSGYGAFQQDDEKIIDFMLDSVYYSREESTSLIAVKKLYTQLANMAVVETPVYTMNGPLYILKPGAIPYAALAKNDYYNFQKLEMHLNWNNAVSYYMIALVFGMVDSMTKNLTIRNWGDDIWWTAFYDMDTAFGVNNAGQDVVEYWAHLHKWRNYTNTDGITDFTVDKNYPDGTDGIKQYFASYWNRIWEIVERLPGEDTGGTAARTSLEKKYIQLRTELFPDPDVFIDKYYKSYTEQTGALMFNYDYKIKYLKISQNYDISLKKYTDSTDFSQLKFLHGNRVVHVKDWFRKRILFFDSIYGYVDGLMSIPVTIESPITQGWLDNKASGVGQNPLFEVIMKSSSRVLYNWSVDGGTKGNFWIDDKDTAAVVMHPAGETIVSMYANKYITKFDNFKTYKWTSLPSIDFPLLKELDLSGLTNIPNTFFTGGAYNPATGVGLKSVEKLLLKNVKILPPTISQGVYNLNLSECYYLKYLDISSSNITKVSLPTSASLKYYNLSNTTIDELTLTGQSFLEDLILEGCDNLKTVVIEKCDSLKNLNLPKNVTSVKILNCQLLSELNITYQSVNGSFSELQYIQVENTPGLKKFNASGQNNVSLVLDLKGAKNLEQLILSNTNTLNIQLPTLTEDNVAVFTKLEALDISNTKIAGFKYGLIDHSGYLDLMSFPNLDYIKATGNTSLSEIRCQNNPLNPINLPSQAFMGCSNLIRTIGNYNITGVETFKDCGRYILNPESVYLRHTASTHIPGDDATNLIITSYSLKGGFFNCSSLSHDDFKRIVYQFNPILTSLESTFEGCGRIDGILWRDMFKDCSNVTIIKKIFSGSGISGSVFSRANNFNILDQSTYGLFDYMPKLDNIESAFENSQVDWIDNNLFQPKNGVKYTFQFVDYLFRNCQSLKVAVDTRIPLPIPGILNSETFFIYLQNLWTAVYPKGMFQGCTKIDMEIINDGNNTLLFHTLKGSGAIHNILKNELYTGINLIGEIRENVFGGVSNTIGHPVLYHIPKFTSIQSPFSNSGSNIEVNLNGMEGVFKNINSTLQQAIGIFSGMKIIGIKKIPDKIFEGCVLLNSIESIFSNLTIDNEGLPYKFPNKVIFKDTVSLKSIKNIFLGTNKIRIELQSEGFNNCALTDVSGAFSSSGVFGIIPYRLFFMEDPITKTIKRTIEKMDGVFSRCWLLGYTKERKINQTTEYIINNSNDMAKLSWADNVVLNPGTEVSFKLDVLNMIKTHNYQRDDNLTITNPIPIGRVANPLFIDITTTPGIEPTILDPDYIPIIVNPNYDPGLESYDSWYLDGYGWDDAPISNQELQIQKTRIFDRYFVYDEIQKDVISDYTNVTPKIHIPTLQNYMIPADLFRYCSSEAKLSNVLNDLSWFERVLIGNDSDQIKKVVMTNNTQGLKGRIPMRLFESLVNNKVFDSVFRNTNFNAFYGMRWDLVDGVQVMKRGKVYPIDLLKHNTSLEEIPYLFAGTEITIGVDINKDIFSNNFALAKVVGVWSDVRFNDRPYAAESFGPNDIFQSQIDFYTLFLNNRDLSDASNLFAVFNSDNSDRGLRIIRTDLLSGNRSLNSISNMFSRNALLKGNVPLFKASLYPILNSFSGYLSGVTESNILNRNQLDIRLKPTGWA